MQYGKKEVSLEFGNHSDGVNTVDEHLRIGKNQCRKSENLMLGTKGETRRPGTLGLATRITGRLRGLWRYLMVDTTEHLLTIAGGIVKSVNQTTGAGTDLYTLTGDGEAWFANAYDKCFVANGTAVCKIENATGYRVGIAAPTGASGVKSSGGSLEEGAWDCYVCYARGALLYSSGQNVPVTTDASNLSITFTIPNSSDAQVSDKVIFAKAPSDTTYYYYGHTGDNATTSLVLSAPTNKDVNKIYNTLAATNTLPPALEGLIFHDNRLIGWLNNYVYYSKKAASVYDLDRWNTAGQIAAYPYDVVSVFGVGTELFINTTEGIIRQPGTVFTEQWSQDEHKYYFKYPRTVAEWGGYVIGLTHDGVRVFDPSSGKFLPYDITKDIKTDIDRLYSAITGNCQPCGHVVRRKNRTEYHLCYCDSRYGTENNRRAVLNLDRLAFGSDYIRAPWEFWTTGANYLTEFRNGTLWSAQSRAFSAIYSETTLNTKDYLVYDKADTYLAAAIDSTIELETSLRMIDARGICKWSQMRALIRHVVDVDIDVVIADKSNTEDTEVMRQDSTVPIFGVARFGISRFPAERAQLRKGILKGGTAKGYTVYCRATQTGNDKNFELVTILLYGILTVSRKT